MQNKKPKKNPYKNFGTMVKEFGSNWKTIKETSNKKNKIIKDLLK